MDPLGESFNIDLALRGEEAISGVGISAVDDDLAVVGPGGPFLARVMPGDEQVGIHPIGKAIDRFRSRVSSPGQGIDSAIAFHGFRGPDPRANDFGIEAVKLLAVGDRVAEQDPVWGPHGQGKRSEKLVIGFQDRAGHAAIGGFNPSTEVDIEHHPVFADGPAGQFGKLMVAEDQVNAVGALALQSRDEIDKLMRLITTVIRIEIFPMDQFLEDKMAARLLVETGLGEHMSEKGNIAVQIADNKDLLGAVREPDDGSFSAWSVAEQLGGALKRGENFLRVGHGEQPRE